MEFQEKEKVQKDIRKLLRKKQANINSRLETI